MLILRCVHLEELPHPLPGAGLSGSCLPCETSVTWQCCPSQAQGKTRRKTPMEVARIPALESAPCTNCHSLPVFLGFFLGWCGCNDLTACRGQVSGESSLSCALPAFACPRGVQDHGALGSGALCCWDPGPSGRASEGSRAQTPPSGVALLIHWLLPNDPLAKHSSP